ncbi:uncharacterized protein J4E92_003547 [Alternaria infectoria]|uniref:uncharacterized protein n=1 Tax=Alternaria infectoria TaxID=45303 RepID=UPI00222087B4|nr:uncharacterized protein J4E92_003547 [Alternaria infectoria]KAI4933878.1 hypothetical protein J4E92_003547 [Alternaria infectoria]
MSPNTSATSASTLEGFPYQRTLYIREIEQTPISLMKFPLMIIEPIYEGPGKETTEEVHTLERLKELLEKYYAFLVKTLEAKALYEKRGWDKWLVPKPYDAAAWAATNGDEPCVLPSIRVRFPGHFDS